MIALMQVSRIAASVSIIILLLAPLALSAQTEGELQATIRAAILSDPRTATMSEAEVDAMVAALAQEASAQGMTSQDILWQPQEEGAAGQTVSCGILCMLTNAFGFDGSDVTIPIALGICAALLLFVIGSLLHHHYGRHPVVGALPSST